MSPNDPAPASDQLATRSSRRRVPEGLGNPPLEAITMNRSALNSFTVIAITLSAVGPALTQPVPSIESGSISSGRRIAATICGDCHAASGFTTVGPSFQSIADQPATTAMLLKAFLRSNHDNMPNFIISPNDTDDVIAFILSLKRK